MHFESNRPPYRISTDPSLLDISVIHRYLSEESYWATGRRRETVERSISLSLNFGLYHEADGQVGFARVVTDFTTFAWLCDVFVLQGHRGRGLSKWLMESVMAQPELASMRLFMLGTANAHGLYRQFGFEVSATPERFMERRFRQPDSLDTINSPQ